MFNLLSTVLDKRKFPKARIIVLNDSFNMFQHVTNSLLTVIPRLSEKKKWDLTTKIVKIASVEVWRGNQEQAELYREQLAIK